MPQNRDKTRVVAYRCPSNTAVQVYNYQHKTARVVFGPELVILDPHETFNVLFLSGECCVCAEELEELWFLVAVRDSG